MCAITSTPDSDTNGIPKAAVRKKRNRRVTFSTQREPKAVQCGGAVVEMTFPQGERNARTLYGWKLEGSDAIVNAQR